MKKLITILFAVAAASVMADEYLYWMVDENLTGYSGTWDSAGIRISQTDKYLTLYDGDTGVIDADGFASAAQAKNGMYAQYDVSSGYSYLVDLLWGGKTVAVAESFIPNSDYTTTDMTMLPLQSPQVVSSFTATGAVPEPTSGLLSLFGLALLAIRRKKVA